MLKSERGEGPSGSAQSDQTVLRLQVATLPCVQSRTDFLETKSAKTEAGKAYLLPDEMWVKIFEYLWFQDLESFPLVGQSFANVSRDTKRSCLLNMLNMLLNRLEYPICNIPRKSLTVFESDNDIWNFCSRLTEWPSKMVCAITFIIF